jgi:hypothetical protein
VNALQNGAVLVAEVEGARLAEVGETRLQRPHGGAAAKVGKGYVLKGGDVLHLPPGETVRLEGLPPVVAAYRAGREKAGARDQWIIAADKRILAPPQSRGAKGPAAGELAVIVTGPSHRASWQAARVMKPAPIAEIEAALQEPWRAHGEAGAPLGEKKGMPPLTSEALRRHDQRNNASAERTRRIIEALKAERARRSR